MYNSNETANGMEKLNFSISIANCAIGVRNLNGA